MRRLALCCLALLFAVSLHAQRAEYRGIWVDTFNTLLSDRTDVTNVVNNAKRANANAIFAQVRRRGDSWYLNSLEPLPDIPKKIVPPFDPLAELIKQAHAAGIEVHAYVIIGAIWASASTPPDVKLPTSPNHPFNLHGGYDPVSKTIVDGPDNWLTHMEPSFGTTGSTFNGYRFANDFWIDLGHPAAAEYSVQVMMTLVRNYDIDGLHFDRIRYPDFSPGYLQTPSTGTNIGYNARNVARFNAHYGRTGIPPQNDAAWSQWRRDQVSNFVRRVYLSAIAEKPQLKISAALIANNGIGATESAWNSAEAYWRVYQDWRAWTEDGILDLPMPMAYKGEHSATVGPQFDQWLAWLRNHQYNRAGVIGIGGSVNAIEGTLRQTRRALLPADPSNNVAGVILYSMATSNIAVTNNIWAIPPGATPVRSFNEFASGLKTGKSVDGTKWYEDLSQNPTAVFNQPATIPALSWKASPSKGHWMGFARRADATILDAADTIVANSITGDVRHGATDGNGFFGAVDLQPGLYVASATLGTETLYSCAMNVIAGKVVSADATSSTAPVVTLPVDLTVNTDHGSCSAIVAAPSIVDACSAQREITGTRSDRLSTRAPYPLGTTTVTWTVSDTNGSTTLGTQTITVKDAEPPAIVNLRTDQQRLWPANHKMQSVKVLYGADDNCSAVSTSITVASNELEDGLGDGDTSPDWEIVSNHEVRLRAERSATGTGRVYTITVTATDAAGNVSAASTTVGVPLSEGNH